ncbi:hypothetical protein E9531_02280 [Lampropedia puyangensis]|uniref:TonB C-terminal domain-containing protein n=1 Tax=Lampropedia puyangensis TaxID=1330072 RepID=A0A4V4GSR3_9BURK|nr:hypothetical protein [Lampropedia puyangensis]THU05386.1 hypothetical protein E9531_02280 [Lampropedia puyangensis]
MTAVCLGTILAGCATKPPPPNPRSVEMPWKCKTKVRYPSLALRTYFETTVIMDFWVQADGSITDLAPYQPANRLLKQIRTAPSAANEATRTNVANAFDKEVARFIQSCRFPPAPGFDPAKVRLPLQFTFPSSSDTSSNDNGR